MSDYLYSATDWLSRCLPKAKEVEKVVIKEIKTVMPQRGQLFVRLAGLSGALAVSLGAYGSHVFRHSEADDQAKFTFETGNRYHFFHTLALLAVPMTRRPYLSGTMILFGMMMFCGPCYVHALTGNVGIRKITPYGGMLLIAGWASMIL